MTKFSLLLKNISFILIPVFLLGLFAVNGFVAWEQSAWPETNPRDYPDVLKALEYPKPIWLKHFPANIPSTATNPSIYWCKGFLQASMFLQLRYQLPQKEIDKILLDGLKMAANLPSDGNSPNYKVPWTPLFAGENEHLREWPADFQIIVFHYPLMKGSWEDQMSYGIAVSRERNQVIYWMEEGY